MTLWLSCALAGPVLDDEVEYKLVLPADVDRLAVQKVFDEHVRPIAAPKGHKHAGKVWDDKDCESIRFYPVDDGLFLRLRVDHEGKDCSSPMEKWDATAKWVSETPTGRPALPAETDWIVGSSGQQIRYAASNKVKSKDLGALPADGMAVAAAVGLSSELVPASLPSACASEIHAFEWRTTWDRDAAGAEVPIASFTRWTLDGQPLAAELSFDGDPDDLALAAALAKALGSTLAVEPLSKTQRALAACSD
ncbi:MAG: hypothetical protein GY913_31175 [Proteobacteria bacterium]|nr:hypothetical protein [Pseudomonadota bacterium]MCP4921381.1 hypothetical protein [Pseudomonadota bacterium]